MAIATSPLKPPGPAAVDSVRRAADIVEQAFGTGRPVLAGR